MIMEHNTGSIYPDSQHPDHGRPIEWITKPYSIAITAVALFLLIFGFNIFLGYQHFESTRSNALSADRTTANLLADLLLEHNKATTGILQSYAYRPLFVAAVKNKNVEGVNRDLSALKNNSEIDLTFVTDTRGILWANYPWFPEAIGKDLSYRDWYKGISSNWKPYISTVFKLIVGDKPLAAAVCVPIFDEKNRAIGILASSQRLDYIANAIERVSFRPYTTVTVIDRVGQILYSNKYTYRDKVTNYPHLSIINIALKDKRQQIEDKMHNDLGEIYLTVVPVGYVGWTVIVERSLGDIYRSEVRRFIEIGIVSLLLFILIIFSLVYLRKASLFRKTAELLQAEKKLRQESEKLRVLSSRHEAILAAVPEIIMEVDNNKVYTWANSVGIEFFGEDVIGKEAAFYFEDDQDTYVIVKPLFNYAEDVIYLENWQRRRDGEKRLLAWWCRALKDENGQITGALSSARDITEIKLAEEEIKRLNADLEQRVIDRTAQLEAANRELEAFSYSVSHDLRAPLRSIDGFSQALLEHCGNNLDEKGKTYLDRVRRATQNMGRLIDDMLKLSRITQAEFKRQNVNLSNMITEITKAHQRDNPDKAVDFAIQDGVIIQGDPYLMQIAMENLMGNAWKFTGKAAYSKIEFGTTVREGKTVCFIRDNGAGFDMAYVGKLFGSFQRLHTTSEFPGTGIGLATVQRIINRHKGRIWAEGEVGKGATFYFTVP